jgi:predicted ATPase
LLHRTLQRYPSGVSVRFLHRVRLKNYRSIARADVAIGSLTLLVGPNGSGKSNFLDALRLIADSLRTSIDHALRDRGGIDAVRRRSGGHPTHFGIRVDFQLDDARTGHYAFKIGARAPGGFVVQEEECRIDAPVLGAHHYHLKAGTLVSSSESVMPPAAEDRLYLVNAAGRPEFRPVYDHLSAMGFYNLNPDRIRALQSPDSGDILARDGGNLASVLHRLEKVDDGRLKQRIEEYLAQVVPGVVGVDRRPLGPMETIEFRQNVAGQPKPWHFGAMNMSDGTLRALGILVALFQARNGRKVPLVGIEEPEAALHPAAASVLRDCLRDGSRHTQVLVTSHSPELLDDKNLDPESILAVSSEDGTTRISTLDEASLSALRDRLYTPGELLRANQLAPGMTLGPDAQLDLFDADAG